MMQNSRLLRFRICPHQPAGLTCVEGEVSASIMHGTSQLILWYNLCPDKEEQLDSWRHFSWVERAVRSFPRLFGRLGAHIKSQTSQCNSDCATHGATASWMSNLGTECHQINSIENTVSLGLSMAVHCWSAAWDCPPSHQPTADVPVRFERANEASSWPCLQLRSLPSTAKRTKGGFQSFALIVGPHASNVLPTKGSPGVLGVLAPKSSAAGVALGATLAARASSGSRLAGVWLRRRRISVALMCPSRSSPATSNSSSVHACGRHSQQLMDHMIMDLMIHTGCTFLPATPLLLCIRTSNALPPLASPSHLFPAFFSCALRMEGSELHRHQDRLLVRRS